MKMRRVVCFEPFTFKDGVRYAWVIYELPVDDHQHVGERRCVGVSEGDERPSVEAST